MNCCINELIFYLNARLAGGTTSDYFEFDKTTSQTPDSYNNSE